MGSRFDYRAIVKKHANDLPHWYAPHGVYFVTFRLADSLPREVVTRLRLERQHLIDVVRERYGVVSEEAIAEIDSTVRMRMEEELDRSAGVCYLRDPRVAACVADSICFFDRERYELDAWCVMPNHVHAVFELMEGETLDRTMHSWKSFTAKRANAILGRSGAFWQPDYYDRLIRCAAELHATVEYVVGNPVAAGLTDWPWVGWREAVRCRG